MIFEKETYFVWNIFFSNSDQKLITYFVSDFVSAISIYIYDFGI